MPDLPLRILVLASHPVQYGAPFYRAFSNHPGVELTVAYCSLRGAEPGYDKEFATDIAWDLPLLDGYKWVHVANRTFSRDDASFFGLCNPGLWDLIRPGKFDAVISFVGYVRCSFWIALAAAKVSGTPFLFGTDASSILPRGDQAQNAGLGLKLKLALKRIVWRTVFGLADQVLTASTPGKEMLESLGIAADRISMTLITVNNDWWTAQSAGIDRFAVRHSAGLGSGDFVILFCGKLQPWKRPADVLRAFAAAGIPEGRLIFAGEGPLRASLEHQSGALGLGERVRFPGFVNQTQLPAVYKSADLMVISSDYEPFGLVVNEAMLCDCPVLASDRVGAVRDLIDPGRTGFVYPCGDVEALAKLMRELAERRNFLAGISLGARERMKTWSYREVIAAMIDAVNRATVRSNPRRSRREPDEIATKAAKQAGEANP